MTIQYTRSIWDIIERNPCYEFVWHWFRRETVLFAPDVETARNAALLRVMALALEGWVSKDSVAAVDAYLKTWEPSRVRCQWGLLDTESAEDELIVNPRVVASCYKIIECMESEECFELARRFAPKEFPGTRTTFGTLTPDDRFRYMVDEDTINAMEEEQGVVEAGTPVFEGAIVLWQPPCDEKRDRFRVDHARFIPVVIGDHMFQHNYPEGKRIWLDYGVVVLPPFLK